MNHRRRLLFTNFQRRKALRNKKTSFESNTRGRLKSDVRNILYAVCG